VFTVFMTTSVEFARNAFQCATINTGSQKSSRAVVQDCKTVFNYNTGALALVSGAANRLM